jgi:hypothetical protein
LVGQQKNGAAQEIADQRDLFLSPLRPPDAKV